MIEPKRLLSKLLAEENVDIEFRSSATASFDLVKRIIYLPELKANLSENISFGFIVHEIGHALFTPTDDWLDAVTDENKSLLNIIEDSRIERKIVRKYPGVKRDLISGYQDLLTIDFFNIANQNINELNFLDRLNLYEKCGATLLIKFNPAEQSLVDKVQSTDTFDDVLNVAMLIEEYLKNNPQPIRENDTVGYSIAYRDEKNPLQSITMDALEENKGSLLSDDSKASLYIDIDIPNSKNFIMDFKILYQEIKDNFTLNSVTIDTSLPTYNEYLRKNKTIIDYLACEFTLNQNAKQLRKSKVNITGTLDGKKLYIYQLTDKIFKSNHITGNGKNHGMVMFVDWSGSMAKCLNSVIEQTLNICFFCKKLGIPFEVYAFTSSVPKKFTVVTPMTNNQTYFNENNMMLMNIISSRMSDMELKYAANFLMSIRQGVYFIEYVTSTYNASLPRWFNLKYTPLDETVVLAMNIVPKFKSDNNLDICSTIFLSDGESSNNIPFIDNGYCSSKLWVVGRLKNVFLRNPKTKTVSKLKYNDNYHYKVPSSVSLFSILKQDLDDPVIGFRLTNSKDIMNGRVNHHFSNCEEEHLLKYRTEFNSNNFIAVQNEMYDVSFLVKDLNGTDEDYELDKNVSKQKMIGKFVKSNLQKKTSRLLLQQFIKVIS